MIVLQLLGLFKPFTIIEILMKIFSVTDRNISKQKSTRKFGILNVLLNK